MLTQPVRLFLLGLFAWSLSACIGNNQGMTPALATQAVATETGPVVTPTVIQAPPTSTPTAAPAESPSTLSLEVLRNGVYRSPDWGEFQLVEGVYYRPPPTSLESPEIYKTHLLDMVLSGDLNADGVIDAVVFLSTQNGGTGHFIEMAAVLNVKGSAQNISTRYLGDRVIIESAVIVNGLLTLGMRISGPNDGACCPSQTVTWSFLLENGQWVQTPSPTSANDVLTYHSQVLGLTLQYPLDWEVMELPNADFSTHPPTLWLHGPGSGFPHPQTDAQPELSIQLVDEESAGQWTSLEFQDKLVAYQATPFQLGQVPATLITGEYRPDENILAEWHWQVFVALAPWGQHYLLAEACLTCHNSELYSTILASITGSQP